MISLIKQPAETLRQPMTFGGVSTISALVSIGVTDRGLVSGGAALTANGTLFANALTIEIGGGADGERYLITAVVDDADGGRREEEIEVAVMDHQWVMPDGGAPMLTIAKFVERCGIDEVVRMTDTRGDGRIGRDLLVSALKDAQALVEMHVQARYALPLDPVPTIVEMAIADIARGRLYPGGVPEGVAGSARAAMKTLERIQLGQLPLSAAEIGSTASETPIMSYSGGRAYPDGLAGY